MKAEKERRSRSASFVLVSCCCSNYEMSNGTVIKRPSSIHQRPSTSVRLFARNEINHRRLFALAFEKKKRKKEERNQIAKRFSSFFFVEERHLINPNRRNKAIFLTFFFFFFFLHELFHFVPCRQPRQLPLRRIVKELEQLFSNFYEISL